jgi:hypothetical protein
MLSTHVCKTPISKSKFTLIRINFACNQQLSVCAIQSLYDRYLLAVTLSFDFSLRSAVHGAGFFSWKLEMVCFNAGFDNCIGAIGRRAKGVCTQSDRVLYCARHRATSRQIKTHPICVSPVASCCATRKSFFV